MKKETRIEKYELRMWVESGTLFVSRHETLEEAEKVRAKKATGDFRNSYYISKL